MLARIQSCALAGLVGRRVQVEVDIHAALPRTTIVGLPDAAVRESKDRLHAALRHARLAYPRAHITINLAPAAVRKEGPAYDLPIALGILRASGQIDDDLDDGLVFGEVALDGALRHTRGILPVSLAARAFGCRRIVIPAENGAEAGLVAGLEVVAAPDLASLVAHLRGHRALPPAAPGGTPPMPPDDHLDLQHVRGQWHARRALAIAAAGGHSLLFTEPPGAGKTILARCLPSILPPLSESEALEVTAVYSVAGALPAVESLLRARPFRSPHHSISSAGLIGGASSSRTDS